MPVLKETKARVVTDIKIIEEHTNKVRKEHSNTHTYCSAIVLCVYATKRCRVTTCVYSIHYIFCWFISKYPKHFVSDIM